MIENDIWMVLEHFKNDFKSISWCKMNSDDFQGYLMI